MSTPSFRQEVAGRDQRPTRELMQWIQRIVDQPLGQMLVTDTGEAPAMKKYGTIVWQDTSLAKTYIVHYDGEHRYYWEMTGMDLY